MPEIGIRDLKARASEVIRSVREKRARYLVTFRGRPVAAIVPLDRGEAATPGISQAWRTLTEIGEEIGRGWRSDQSSLELLKEIRR